MSEDNKETKKNIVFDTIQQAQDSQNADLVSKFTKNEDMMKSLIQYATGSAGNKRNAPRLAFTENPYTRDNYAGIYKLKKDLTPPAIIKEIRVRNLLIAAILRARGNAMASFGHIRKDRFDVGIEVDVLNKFKDHISPEHKGKIDERIERFLKILVNCGFTDGIDYDDRLTLPDFFDLQSRNGLSFGQFATEIVYTEPSTPDETPKFHRFRVADAGTIYKTVKKGESAESVRKASVKLLESLTGTSIDADIFEKDEYAWVQVVDGTPQQAFTSDELLVYNLFPSSDVEHNGYPVTPIDTAINAITTYQSVESYNRLYFQNGRAAKGMMVIKSDEIDQNSLDDIKQQFNASINNVNNSFRTPVFGVSREDDVAWVPTQTGSKDIEFQFLYDQVIRNVLGAFGMSPDELPGFSHLSRGTSQQSLSESNNEFKLTSQRDNSFRPLVLKMQDFLNEFLFPIIDPELSQLCYISLAGFDAKTREQESAQLQADQGIHMTYDEVMEETDKPEVGPSMGGNVPFNEYYRQTLDTYKNVGHVESFFRDSPAAMVDPLLKYRRDQFWFENIQLLGEANPAALRAWAVTRKDSLDILKMFIEDYLNEADID